MLAERLFAECKRGLFFILGPCVLEDMDIALEVGRKVQSIATEYSVPIIFKSSFDKANRTSLASFRGPGLKKGLEMLARIKEETGLPIITDIHEPSQAPVVAEVVDVIQIPAFLCRQTDMLLAAGDTGKVINIKKAQFLAPWDIRNVIEKVVSTGNKKIFITERGTTFGYNNLVVDFRSIPLIKGFGYPVVMDATHSVQIPGGKGSCSGGNREFVPTLAACGVVAGCDGVFMEVHPSPERALCDGPNSWPLDRVEGLIDYLLRLREVEYINA